MLQEALEIFEKKLSKNNKLVIDTYSLKEGTYRLIEMTNDEWKIRKTLDIYYDKKSKETIGKNDEDFYMFKQLDYYSKLLEMNKPIDPKKIIHSNNYLTIAVKKENIVLKKLTQDIIKNYYQILKFPISKYNKKLSSKKLYEKVEKKLGQVNLSLLEKIENYVLNNDIFEGIDLDKKGYVKIFFVFPDKEKTITCYKKEYERYLLPNLYNSNDYNIEDHDGELLGLPNNNMGMNSKKPFLESKTKKVKVPYLLNQQKALLQSQFFDYLWGKVSHGQYDFYVITDEHKEDIQSLDDINASASGYYFRCQKEKNEVKIVQCNNITNYSKKLDEPFVLKDYIDIPEDIKMKSQFDYDIYIDDLWKICQLVDEVFFDGKLRFNFYSEMSDIQINDSELKRCLVENRDILSSWFCIGATNGLKEAIDKFSIEIILNSLRNGNVYKARTQFNLRWSLLSYFDKERSIGESMIEIKNRLRQHINLLAGEDWDFDNDEEFAYAVGQIVSYFSSLNKSKNKSQMFINGYLNAKNVEILKGKIENAYKKYNYLMSLNSKSKESQMLSHIMTYKPQKINTECIIAGFTAESLIYEKKKEENEDE